MPDQPAGGPYGYDWVGNRLNPPTGTNHMVYNAADQLTSWPGMHQYAYYPDGSLQYEKNADGSQVMKSYAYTPDGLLATAAFDNKTLTNTWDADKNRVKFSLNSVDHTFVYDTTAGIPAVVKEDGIYCVREPEGSLIARIDGSNLSYYHFDQLGSARLLTDGSGRVTDRYDYDAYGAVIAHDRLAGSVDQPYQYVGRLGYYTDGLSGFELLMLGQRAYDQEAMRFTQCDPIGVEMNYYAYVYCDPLQGTDPTGKCSDFDDIQNFNHIHVGKTGYEMLTPFTDRECGKWHHKAQRRCLSNFLREQKRITGSQGMCACTDLVMRPKPGVIKGPDGEYIIDDSRGQLYDCGAATRDLAYERDSDAAERELDRCNRQVDYDYNRCMKHSHDKPVRIIKPGLPPDY